MNPADIDRVFGRGRLRMVTGDHVEVFREEALPGERRRYTQRFLATEAGDFRHWTEREWRILARLVGHGVGPVPDVVQFDRGSADRPALVQTYDAGVTVDHWATLLPVERDGTVLRHVFEDCAHWWALARHCLLALDAIHELHLVHLDLKADNVCIPLGPADFDPHAPDRTLHPRFEQIALIDFAFSLISGESLVGALPIARQAEYDYQSPRLLQALEAGRGGDLVPTRQLDWRCDMFSLAAMLRRYLPHPEALPSGCWNRERYARARALVRRLLEAHDADRSVQRPHAELIALASVDEDGFADSLQRGWILARGSVPAGDESPTPVTRIALPVAAANPEPEPVAIALTSVDRAAPPPRARNPERTRKALLASGLAAAAVVSIPVLGEVWRVLQRPETTLAASAVAPPATERRVDPEVALRLPSATDRRIVEPAREVVLPSSSPIAAPDLPPGQAPAASVPAAAAAPAAEPPTPAPPETAAATAPRSEPPQSEPPRSAELPRTAERSRIGGIGHGTTAASSRRSRVAADEPRRSAQGYAAAAAAMPMLAPRAPAVAGHHAAALPTHARAATPTPARGYAAVLARMPPAKPISIAAPATKVATAPTSGLVFAAAAMGVPASPTSSPAATSTTPATSSAAAPPSAPPTTPGTSAAALPSGSEPAAAYPTSRAPAPEMAASPPVRPDDRLASRDFVARADELMKNQVPRIVQRAERLVLRVLHAAGQAESAGQDDEIRNVAGAVRLAPDDPLLAMGVSANDARLLNEAARAAWGRRGGAQEALVFQTGAFGANPLSAEVAGNLAYLRLRQNPAQAETARQLALHALVISDGRYRYGRIEDWTTLAIASALSGRERDARNAWFVTVALAPSIERQCRAALNAYAIHGEPVRASVEAMLYRVHASGRSERSPFCEWPAHWMVPGQVRAASTG
jgi:hypothetical protein